MHCTFKTIIKIMRAKTGDLAARRPVVGPRWIKWYKYTNNCNNEDQSNPQISPSREGPGPVPPSNTMLLETSRVTSDSAKWPHSVQRFSRVHEYYRQYTYGRTDHATVTCVAIITRKYVCIAIITRKSCCRKETARYRGCSFRFKVRRQNSLQV